MENANKTRSNKEISKLRNWVEEQINELKVACNQKRTDALTFGGIH